MHTTAAKAQPIKETTVKKHKAYGPKISLPYSNNSERSKKAWKKNKKDQRN